MSIALITYLTILLISLIIGIILVKPHGKAIVFTIAQSALSAVIGFYIPEWILWILNCGMIVSAAYSIYIINKMQMWKIFEKTEIIEEEYDVDEDADRIPADVLKAWSEVRNAPQD
jgi:hypothetical protein